MKPTYFAVGNFWLFVSLVLAFGRFRESHAPMYSFFGIGTWYYPATYNVWVGLCLFAAAVCLVLWRWRPADRDR